MKITVRTKQLKDGRKSLYLDIYHAGKRHTEFLSLYLGKDRKHNAEIKALAEKHRAFREVELANHQYGFLPSFKRKADFLEYFKSQLKKKQPYSIYHSTVRKLEKFAKGKVLFGEVDEKWLASFRDFLLSEPIAQNTAREYFAVVKRILRKAVKDKIIPSNPADNVDSIRQIDIKRDHLSLNEIESLAKTACTKPEVKRAFLFCCFTGLRFSDVSKLTWGDIKEDHIEIRQTKTKDYLYVPLGETARRLLQVHPPNVKFMPDQRVFDLPQRSHTNIILKRWFAEVGVQKNAHFHVSRHSFAVLNISQGAELYTVSQLLGHKNLRTTEIYAKLINEKKKDAVDRLPFVEVS